MTTARRMSTSCSLVRVGVAEILLVVGVSPLSKARSAEALV